MLEERKKNERKITNRMNRRFDPRHGTDTWSSVLSEETVPSPVASCPQAAVTNAHQLGGSKQQRSALS